MLRFRRRMFRHQHGGGDDDDDDNDDQSIADKYGIRAFTHYTGDDALIKILKSRMLLSSQFCPTVMTQECENAIYTTTLFNFQIERGFHSPCHILLVLSPKILDDFSDQIHFNDQIDYGVFSPSRSYSLAMGNMNQFVEQQREKFEEGTFKVSTILNEMVLKADFLDLTKYLLEIRVIGGDNCGVNRMERLMTRIESDPELLPFRSIFSFVNDGRIKRIPYRVEPEIAELPPPDFQSVIVAQGETSSSSSTSLKTK